MIEETEDDYSDESDAEVEEEFALVELDEDAPAGKERAAADAVQADSEKSGAGYCLNTKYMV